MVEVCFLDMQATGPVLETDESFDFDAKRWKIRHVVAAAAVDAKAGYKNPGV